MLKKDERIKTLDWKAGRARLPGIQLSAGRSGAPFIFMNAAGQMHDLTTMVA